MRKWVLWAAFACFFSTTGFCQIKKKLANDLTISAAQLSKGQTVYENVCSACHQADGTGVPSLNPPLVKNDWVSGDKTRLINIVLKGLQEKIEVNGEAYDNVMPANDYLSDQEIADVLTFVRNSFGNKASNVSAAEVKTQRAKK